MSDICMDKHIGHELVRLKMNRFDVIKPEHLFQVDSIFA